MPFRLPHQLGADTGQGQEEAWPAAVWLDDGPVTLDLVRVGGKVKVRAVRRDGTWAAFDVTDPPAGRLAATAAALMMLGGEHG